ncbi:MAG TPA: TolC family protein [Casimicrobiaceae bacterium]|nr:TolC family protein [Casimicrobiaceae bacterium]
MRLRSFSLALLLASTALAGCALQAPPRPDEVRAQSLPNLAVPPQWAVAVQAAGAVGDHWLALFDDAQLDRLVREALAYNTDLRVAAARIEQAAGYAKLAGSTIYPVVNLLAHGGGKGGGDGSGVTGVWLMANWELDLWGRVRAQREAGTQQYESALADAEYARQSIAAMVAKSWMLAIEARLQLAIAEDIVRASEHALSLAHDRERVGSGDGYDVALAEANLETSRDAVRKLAFGQEQALRALETLVGRYPAAAVEVATALPALPGPVPVGLPSELLERRPDVIAAERRVDAAFYNVAEAKAARLPKIALTAGVSAISSSLFVLENHDNPVWSLGGNILAPIFNGYSLQAQVDIRTAEQKLAIADYGRIAQRAFGEVESALSAASAADAREAILARAAASEARALQLAEVRYKVGSGDLRAVLQQSVALYGARTALLQVQTDRRVQRVNLYLALGGGFEAATPTAAVEHQGPAVAGIASAGTPGAAR